MSEPASLVEAMHVQLSTWPAMAADDRAADRLLLLFMAEGIDKAVEGVREGSAALPLINACRYLLDSMRKAAPDNPGGDGFDELLYEE